MVTQTTGATKPTTSDTIAIVGAGPGGLAAALLLASSGHRVKVYEAQERVGGRTARITLGDYHFDRGPTFFLMPYVLEEIFQAAGRNLGDYATLHELDPMYRLIIGNEQGGDPYIIDATRDIAEMSRRLSAINPSDGLAFERFIADNRKKLLAAEPILRRPIRSLLDLMAPDALKAAPHIKPHLSVHQLLSKYFHHHAVQFAVCFQSKYLGMSPYNCPSLFTILPFIEYEYGIWHPIGGCNALMTAMAEVLEELGGEIVTDAPVERINFEGRRATSLTLRDATTIDHDHVVINADAAWAIKNLIPAELRRGTKYEDRKLDEKQYSCSTYMMYLGVDGTIDHIPHHTIYISEHYRQNLDDISHGGRLSEDPSIYLCNASKTDPTLAPAGKSSLYVLVPTPNTKSGIDWQGSMARLRRDALQQLERRMGIEGLEGRVEQEMELAPHHWVQSNINFGATFNLAHNLNQMLHKRPQHKLETFEGVWMVGGGTHPGSGLPVIFLSAQITSKLICDATGKRYSGADVPVLTAESASQRGVIGSHDSASTPQPITA